MSPTLESAPENDHAEESDLDADSGVSTPAPARDLPVPTGAAVAFGGSPLMLFLVAPIALMAGLAMLSVHGVVEGIGEWFRQAVAGAFVLFAIAVWFPRRLAFAGRMVTAIVFLACCGYVVDRLIAHARGAIGPRDFGILDSLQAFFAFGLPSLWFTLRTSSARRLSTPPDGDD